MPSPLSVGFLHEGQGLPERAFIDSPLGHYRFCKTLLDSIRQGRSLSDVKSGFQRALRYPFASTFQPSIAALALLSRALGKERPPTVPKLHASGAPSSIKGSHSYPLPLPIAFELAQMWRELGFYDEARLASAWIERFGSRGRFLFFSENAFQEDPVLPHQRRPAADCELGLAAYSSERMDAAFALSGFNSGLGSIRLGAVSICAFGPQIEPLGDTSRFGIAHSQACGNVVFTSRNEVEIEGWTRCCGSLETWLHMRACVKNECIRIETRFACDEAIRPMIAFYARANTCSFEGRMFSSGSLQTYRGKAGKVLLDGQALLECSDQDVFMQIIPLAGQDCYWNANFLISFSANSLVFNLSLL